jgi:hypothetical protein
VVATAVTLLNWPGWAQVKPGLDISWQAGLAMAFTRHLQWGPALDFTYGPYGFAGFIEPFYRLTALIAVAHVFVVTWSLASLLIVALRRYWGLATAGVVGWAVIAVSWAAMRSADFASLVGLGLALALIQGRDKGVRVGLAAVLGALAGMELLVKLNTGGVMFAMLALAVAGADGSWRERVRMAGQAGAVAVAAFAIAWVAAGQSFTNLASFGRASVSLFLGYSAAMSAEVRSARVVWCAVAVITTAALVFAVALRRKPGRHQFAVVVMLVGWGWAVTKDGFVGGNHFPGFFRIVFAAVALAGVVRPPRRVYAVALALAACIAVATANLPPIDPLESLHSFVAELADIAQPGRFSQLSGRARARVVKEEPLSPSTLSLVRGQSVAIEPWEDIIAWADPGVRWDPEPVVQAYSAYTVYLDRLDATFLASRRAPHRILYWHYRFSFDSRDPFMDPPATTEAIYCHYAQLTVTGPWQVLRRVPDRCGPEVTISKARTRFGQRIRVPSAPGGMVVASFSFASQALSKVEGILLKPPAMYLTTWSGRRAPVTYRFVPGTAGDEHVLSVPAALGYAARFTPTPVHELELSGGGWGTDQGSVTVTFSAVSMAPG